MFKQTKRRPHSLSYACCLIVCGQVTDVRHHIHTSKDKQPSLEHVLAAHQPVPGHITDMSLIPANTASWATMCEQQVLASQEISLVRQHSTLKASQHRILDSMHHLELVAGSGSNSSVVLHHKNTEEYESHIDTTPSTESHEIGERHKSA